MKQLQTLFLALTLVLFSACSSPSDSKETSPDKTQQPGDGNVSKNKAPVVDAGKDDSVKVGGKVTLKGMATDPDGSIATVKWTKDGKDLTAKSDYIFTPVSIGKQVFIFSATDDKGATASDSVTITVNPVPVGNKPPVANAGNDLAVKKGDTLHISGTATDSDGTVVSYKWSKGSTPLATQASFDYTPTVVGTDTLTLTVTDDEGATDTDTITVTVSATVVPNNPPKAIAGLDQTTDVNVAVTLSGRGTDADGSVVSYNWTENGVSFSTDANTSYTPITTGSHTLTLTVTDDDGATASDTLVITANDPIVDTTKPVLTIVGDNPLTLVKGTAYTEPGATALDDTDGDITAQIVVTGSVDTSTVGQYFVSYSVDDAAGNSASEVRAVNVVDDLSVIAAYDLVEANVSDGMVTVNVLSNDKPKTATVTLLHSMDSFGQWAVVDNNLTYTPDNNPLFSGGLVGAEYEISDGAHKAKAYAFIKYPTVFDAKDDEVTLASIAPHTIDILSNDICKDGPCNVELVYPYDSSGVWSLVDNNVTFTPDPKFGGGLVSNSYTLTDTLGREDRADITLNYPKILYAKGDDFNRTSLTDWSVPERLDVIANDKKTGSVEVRFNSGGSLQTQMDNAQAHYEVDITTNEILITPKPAFGGGTISFSYVLTNGTLSSIGNVEVDYAEVLVAKGDYRKVSNVTDTINIAVLSNDINSSTPTLEIETGYNYISGEFIYSYGTSVQTAEGSWSVEANNTVTFVPSSTFAGGYISRNYKITDNGKESSARISLVYPIALEAKNDRVKVSGMTATTVIVLDNDTNLSTIAKVEIEAGYDTTTWQPLFGSFYKTEEGNWSVEADNTVMFVPSPSFAGGSVSLNYKITDSSMREATAAIVIDYDVVLRAKYDEKVESGLTRKVSINVLANDIVTDTPATLQFANVWGQNTPDGNWTLENNTTVSFTPSSTFGGGEKSITYVITDAVGRQSSARVKVIYDEVIKAKKIYLDKSDNINNINLATNVQIFFPGTSTDGNETQLIDYDANTFEPIYVKSVSSNEGHWSVEANQSITFVPSPTWGGGYITVGYRILNLAGRMSTANISIIYPTVLGAKGYAVQETDLLKVMTFDVVADSTIASTLDTVSLGSSSGDGVWSIDASNVISFTPNASNSIGSSADLEYTITDTDGRSSSSSINIYY